MADVWAHIRHPTSLLLIFLVIEACREVIDIGLVRQILFFFGTENLPRQPFLEGFFATIGFELLSANTCRLGIRTEILPAGPVGARIVHRSWFCECRGGWSAVEWRGRPRRSGSVSVSGACFVYRQWSAFE